MSGQSAKMHDLRTEIQVALNKHAAEDGSNTPDFILADYLTSCLSAFDRATQAREEWGRIPEATPAAGVGAPDPERIVSDGLGRLSEAERNTLDDAVQRVIAARLAQALVVVKRACDIECKSPGKHTGCHAHEPYRALAAAVFPPGTD